MHDCRWTQPTTRGRRPRTGVGRRAYTGPYRLRLLEGAAAAAVALGVLAGCTGAPGPAQPPPAAAPTTSAAPDRDAPDASAQGGEPTAGAAARPSERPSAPRSDAPRSHRPRLVHVDT